MMFDAYDSRKRARASQPGMVRRSVMLPQAFADRIDREAVTARCTPSQVIRQYIVAGMVAQIEENIADTERGGLIA